MSEPTGAVATAIAHARQLMSQRPDLAEAQAGEILKAVPGHPEALLLAGQARRLQGDPAGAQAILADLTTAQPQWAAGWHELGLAQAARG
ncbi:tetratricopeptide repeat protein, partial [Phenylobacterium conjunctum]